MLWIICQDFIAHYSKCFELTIQVRDCAYAYMCWHHISALCRRRWGENSAHGEEVHCARAVALMNSQHSTNHFSLSLSADNNDIFSSRWIDKAGQNRARTIGPAWDSLLLATSALEQSFKRQAWRTHKTPQDASIMRAADWEYIFGPILRTFCKELFADAPPYRRWPN